jgi:hypothetical protein
MMETHTTNAPDTALNDKILRLVTLSMQNGVEPMFILKPRVQAGRLQYSLTVNLGRGDKIIISSSIVQESVIGVMNDAVIKLLGQPNIKDISGGYRYGQTWPGIEGSTTEFKGTEESSNGPWPITGFRNSFSKYTGRLITSFLNAGIRNATIVYGVYDRTRIIHGISDKPWRDRSAQLSHLKEVYERKFKNQFRTHCHPQNFAEAICASIDVHIDEVESNIKDMLVFIVRVILDVSGNIQIPETCLWNSSVYRRVGSEMRCTHLNKVELQAS